MDKQMKLPERWTTDALGHVAFLIMGQSPESKYYSEQETGLPFLQGCADFGSHFPNHTVFCSQRKKIAPKDSILFSVRAPVGRMNIADQPYIIGRGLASIEGHEVDQAYLAHYLRAEESKFKNISQGSTFEAINSSELNKWIVKYPICLCEQSKIAEVLSTVDKAIEKTEDIIAKQQRIKTGLMQDLLTKGIDEHGNIRSEETHEFKDSPLGRIPVEWEESRLGKCCNVNNNFRKPISSMIRESMQGEWRYYGPTGIIDYINEYRVAGRFVLIGEDGDHFLKFDRQEMTLLVEGEFNVNNHAHILSGNEKVTTDWIHHYYLHRDLTLFLTRQGAGRFKLNKATLLYLPIAFPLNKSEQLVISERINNLRSNCTASAQVLSKLHSLKAALMQDLLTGNVRVTPLIADQKEEVI